MSSSSDDFDKLLDDFISSQLQEAEDALAEIQEAKKNPSSDTDIFTSLLNEEEEKSPLADEEKQLFRAYSEFIGAVTACGEKKNLEIPNFSSLYN